MTDTTTPNDKGLTILGAVTNLGLVRADKSQNTDDWQPIELLRAAVAEIEDGGDPPTRAVLVVTYGENILRWRAAGKASGYDFIGMLMKVVIDMSQT